MIVSVAMKDQVGVRVLKRRVLVFSVPVRRKKSNSVLYLGHTRRGSYTEQQDAWIIALGDGVVGDVATLKRGTRCIIQDSFELSPVSLDLWPTFKDDPTFKELRAFVEDVDGDVETQMLYDDAILAVYE